MEKEDKYVLLKIAPVPNVEVADYYINREHPAREGDAGYDLYCPERVIVPVSFRVEKDPYTTIELGIRIRAERYEYRTYRDLPSIQKTGMWLVPRSSFSTLGLVMANSPGVIDANYRGELKVNVLNVTNHSIEIKRGQRLFQLVGPGMEEIRVEYSNEIDVSDARGGGFGSTGTT